MLKEEIEELKGSVETMEKEVKEQTLALEMFREQKEQNKRKDRIIILLILLLAFSNIAWLIYETQFQTVTETQTVEQHQEDTENSNMSGVIN